jgi:hypothetical protein
MAYFKIFICKTFLAIRILLLEDYVIQSWNRFPFIIIVRSNLVDWIQYKKSFGGSPVSLKRKWIPLSLHVGYHAPLPDCSEIGYKHLGTFSAKQPAVRRAIKLHVADKN